MRFSSQKGGYGEIGRRYGLNWIEPWYGNLLSDNFNMILDHGIVILRLLILTRNYLHNKICITSTIVQARLVGLAHFSVGYIFTYAAFLIASTSGKFG